jgi:hypothetical protein
MEIKIEKIGPDRAAELLATTINRRLQPPHSARLARDMEAGEWRPNSVLQVAHTERGDCLIDGQHRLEAVRITGQPQEFVVIYGLSLDDQKVIDTGRARTLGDTLTLHGEPNATLLAAAVGHLWRRDRRLYTSSNGPTITEGIALLAEHAALQQSIAPTRHASRALKIPFGLACCLHYHMAAIDAESADDFWYKLGTGLDLHATHPVYQLRTRLEANAVSTSVKLGRIVIHALIVKSWNAYIRGEDIRALRWIRGGARPEAFPELEAPLL